ncbi:RNA polymerase alpha subunit C-terminal domain-containing protein [Neobacillus niacini]|uniref:RNA polymerase alpha subunit C-terminal domain-containing protein n=1 Tax=Neobacillus niacini TaxID=86668 RepID=UPI002FFF494F
MVSTNKTLRTCRKGHQFYKSSDCPTCPICEQERKPESGFLATLANPARRALEHQGITTIKELSKYSEKEILTLHGMGPASLPKLRTALETSGLSL